MSCGVQGVTPEWVQIQHRDHGFSEGRGKYSGRWGKVSQNVIKAITEKIKGIVKKAQAWTQDCLIKALNPVIRGWTNYHRHNAASDAFGKLDTYVWKVTWGWGRRRHPNKGRKWVARIYWHSEGDRNWVFQTKENTLLLFSDADYRGHTIPRLDANPYLDRKYFIDRRERTTRKTPWVQTRLTFFALPPEKRVVERASRMR